MKKSREIEFLATIVFESIWNAKTNYKLIVEEGSSRSSKTWSNFQVIFLDLFESPMNSCTILRDTQKSCRDIVEVDWIKWLSDPMGRKKELEDKKISVIEFDKLIKEESLLKYFIRNRTNHTWTYKHNNSFIRFTGLDDEDDAMGMTQDITWINEPYKFSHEVYKQLAQRTSKYILFDWNPKQTHWVNDEKKKNSTITLFSTFEDNPFCPIESKLQIWSYQPLSQHSSILNGNLTQNDLILYDFEENKYKLSNKKINELKRCLYNESVNSASLYHWLVFGRGLKSEKPNRIYNKFIKITDKEFYELPYPSYYGLDFGSTNPSALVEVKYDGNNSFFTKELMYKPINEMEFSLSETLELLGVRKNIIMIYFCWIDTSTIVIFINI